MAKENINMDELIGVIGEVDEFIMHLCIKNKLTPLTGTAIILARLVWLNKQSGSTGELIRLLEDICQKIENIESEETPRNLH